MDLTTAKTVAVFFIVIGCFAVLYPKIFHPMFFGGKTRKSPTDDITDRVPPHLRGKPSAGDRDAAHRQEALNMARQMHRGPHPGMRAAAEMKKAQNTGGGKGMMGIVLPVYAVGIVLYLVYTLAKVFTKKSDGKDYENNLREHYKELRFDAASKKFTFGDMNQEEFENKSGIDFFSDRANQHNLEDLLLKADERNIGEYEMHQLRKKLEETESQMARILEAMQVVQNQSEQLSESTTGHMDSSPDLDTYEVVKGRTKGSLEVTEDFDDLDDGYEESDESEGHIDDIGPIDDDDERDITYSSNADYTQDTAATSDRHGDIDEADQDTGNHGDDEVLTSPDKDIELDTLDTATDDGVETLISSAVNESDVNPDLRHRAVSHKSADTENHED